MTDAESKKLDALIENWRDASGWARRPDTIAGMAEALLKSADKATPGPWFLGEDGLTCTPRRDGLPDAARAGGRTAVEIVDNASFICQARNLIPDVCRGAILLKARLDQIEKWAEQASLKLPGAPHEKKKHTLMPGADRHDCTLVDCYCEHCTDCGAGRYSDAWEQPCPGPEEYDDQ